MQVANTAPQHLSKVFVCCRRRGHTGSLSDIQFEKTTRAESFFRIFLDKPERKQNKQRRAFQRYCGRRASVALKARQTVSQQASPADTVSGCARVMSAHERQGKEEEEDRSKRS